MIPSLREWYDSYAGDEFEIISVHYPEFAFEEEYDNVVAATVELGVEYPVAIDNDARTWRTYQQRYWPTIYLIDKEGNVRYKKIGEGAYDVTERRIVELMQEEVVNSQ